MFKLPMLANHSTDSRIAIMTAMRLPRLSSDIPQLVIASFLLVVGYTKLIPVIDSLMFFQGYATLAELIWQASASFVEIGMGLAIWLRPNSALVFAAVAILMFLFALGAAHEVWRGESVCTCFGRLYVTAEVRLKICLVISAASLILSRWLMLAGTGLSLQSAVLLTVRCAFLGCAIGSLVYLSCVSLGLRTWLADTQLIAAPSSCCKVVLTPSAPESVMITLPLHNRASSDIDVYGTSLGCKAFVLSSMPLRIPAGSVTNFMIQATNAEHSRLIHLKFILFIGDDRGKTKSFPVSLALRSS